MRINFLTLLLCWAVGMAPTAAAQSPRQFILIGVDGMQARHYEELRSEGKLPNFNRLITPSGWSGSAVISHHKITYTAPGNAELHSGLGESETGIHENACGKSLPPGVSTFERLRSFDPRIRLGSIYGKGTCYIPLPLLSHARPIIDWWQDRTSYPQKSFMDDACADSTSVADKADEFLTANAGQAFYLVMYFGTPDCAGHGYGLPSPEYDQALANVDAALGVLLDKLSELKIAPAILVSADHGWNDGTRGHNTANEQTLTIPLITNRSDVVGSTDAAVKHKQCDIAPMILRYFGVKDEAVADITRGGCGGM